MNPYESNMDQVGIDSLSLKDRNARVPKNRRKPSGRDTEADLSVPESYRPAEHRHTRLGSKHHSRLEKPRRPEDLQVERLQEMLGFPRGLAQSLCRHRKDFEYRMWLVDNSGSMIIPDGHRVVQTADRKIVAQDVTRWEEIQETVSYHAQISAILKSPTLFTLLNDPGPDKGPQEFSVAFNRDSNTDVEVQEVKAIMRETEPIGVTPLTSHILRLREWIQKIAPRLRREGKRVVIILATDGQPTDEEGYGGEEIKNEFIHALRGLEGLPVWLVIRLCTDEKDVRDFYNALDERLELSLEVLDDFVGEAKEVYQKNRWLNYALPIHRVRELGFKDRLFDLIDERPLSKGELRDFCSLLFGTEKEKIPDPNVDWKEFLKHVSECLSQEKEHWDPIRKKEGPWINLRALHRCYGKGKCTIM